MLIKVDVVSFGLDATQQIPVIILKESGGSRSLPIMIGSAEAQAIALRALDVTADRPLTIDLAMHIITHLGGELEKVVIYDLVNQVFYAHLHIAAKRSVHVIDCRPSDAIALALRCECPVFAEDSVFEKNESAAPSPEKKTLGKHIADLDTMEFGRYYIP